MTNRDALNLGFEELPNFTIMNSLIFKLSRNRQLSFGSIGTPNEMLFICQIDDKNDKKITDLITLHNYDYDGLMSIEKLKNVINVLS